MRAVKEAVINIALWLLVWLIIPLGAVILYGVYVLTGCRSGRILNAATMLADTFFTLMVLYIMADYYKLIERGDTWLKE